VVVEPKDLNYKGKKAKNKREFYRLVERIRIDVQLLKEQKKDQITDEREMEKHGELTEQFTCDISAGGLQFFSHVFYAENSYLDISLNFKKTDPSFDPVTLRARVLRTVQVENSTFFNIAVQYMDIDQRDRALIERYIFLRQREMIAERRIGYL